ncbi:Dicer-like protein 1 [Parastagonospora nodorum]|nr:Dicer-like protein 1 [Parastagonospora nodorum]KAH4218120.1 Dicer-like protein 1 [Parastagonospora nodorum]KAH4243033.1 Dicer-like protein 1 [Parastagonospora nodorum]KAH4988239.1 Dicer-like protein 1 [Parastagonospora nodorum]KAH5014483.1 Dicer-like protein 1 [Parastagonospora nodorum]
MTWAGDVEEQDDYFSCSDVSTSGDEEESTANVTEANAEKAENSDSDIDADISRAHGPKTTSEKRRTQNEVMRAFAANISASVTQEEVDQATSKIANEGQLSIRDILASQDTAVRITNPRDYQTELFLRAKMQNTIAVLDTGTGKTHIATLLLRHVLEEELENRAKGCAHKMAFFLVDSVNLVFQQANVLRCGLDQGVEGISGAMGQSLFQKQTWDKLFAINMVIVCTAQVLVDCMMHSFMSISRMNLLIFDEAHHAKSNHPYARVMKDYYAHELDTSKRPRIFAMTASPVDVKGQSAEHVREAARELETLLHSRIATTNDSALARNSITRPEEEVAVYTRLRNEFETPLHQKVKAKYGDVAPFRKLFITAKLHASELGRWASDMYWSFAFADEQSRKLQIREELKYNRSKRDWSAAELDAQMARLKEATAFVQQYEIGAPTLSEQDLSSKVMKLQYWLNLYYERTTLARCIVFVEKRHTAQLLKLIFDHIGGPNLHCDVLVGINNRAGEENVSLRSQILTLQKFRRGELNCLFATSVAEEGLDIPQCNLVVRFDLYRTMIGYVQSRGRARHRNSKYLHMLEAENKEHTERLMNARHDENIMREFCKDLTHDRQLGDVEQEKAELIALEDKLFPSYTDEKSGAKLTYRSSLSILSHFVATYPSPDHNTMAQPTYVVNPKISDDPRDPQRNGFVCEVILPEHCPIISMVGQVYSRKTIAKCSAAFKMCIELRRKDHLNEFLLPTISKYLPAMRNALLAVSEKKKGNYAMVIKPTFWKQDRDTVPESLHLTIIDADRGLDRPHQPLAMLTRRPFPQLPSFPIYLTDCRPSNIVSQSLHIPISLTPELLEMFTRFTLRIFEDIYNKVYDYDVSKMSYWMLPVIEHRVASVRSMSNPQEVLDMDQIRKVYNEPFWKWSPQSRTDDLIDRYFVDPMNGGRRYYSDRLAPHLKPQDPVPANVPRQNHKFMKNILDFSDSKWMKSRDITRWHQDQPVLQVEKIPFRRNHLANVEDKEKKELANLETYICPEPLHISNLATPFVVMCYVLPAIIHRFESYLIALDACDVLDLKVSPALALEALTKDSDNSEEHGEEKINFKSGMGPNYERLEFLGDCFLKVATSLSVFVQQPEENEFEFHVRRMLMLCNQNLMETAVGKKKVASANGTERDLQLYKYVRTDAFSRRNWYPEGLKLLRGKGLKKTEEDWLNVTHNLGDKSVADVCEAFIGAAFMQHHKGGQWTPNDWDEAVKAVKLFANSDDHLMEKWTDYYAAYTKPKYQTAGATATQLDLAHKIEMKHPYRFRYPRLLRSAFIHPSQPFMWENIPSYQRLEFLGDSLLDMAFIMHLFYKYPDKDPQWLTEHKTPMVSNKFLGAVCVKLGWHTHMKQNTAILSSQIRDYVYEVEEAEREANGAVDYWVSVSEPPKCLADVIEAFVAAIFVDSEFDFNVVQKFFDLHLRPFFLDMTLDAYENFASNHPTTRLSRLLSINFGCSEWRMGALETETLIPGKGKAIAAMVMIHDKVHFHSLGQSGRYARVRASHAALEKLEGLPPYEFRSKYGCDCVDEGEGEAGVDEAAVSKKVELMREAIGPSI